MRSLYSKYSSFLWYGVFIGFLLTFGQYLFPSLGGLIEKISTFFIKLIPPFGKNNLIIPLIYFLFLSLPFFLLYTLLPKFKSILLKNKGGELSFILRSLIIFFVGITFAYLIFIIIVAVGLSRGGFAL